MLLSAWLHYCCHHEADLHAQHLTSLVAGCNYPHKRLSCFPAAHKLHASMHIHPQMIVPLFGPPLHALDDISH